MWHEDLGSGRQQVSGWALIARDPLSGTTWWHVLPLKSPLPILSKACQAIGHGCELVSRLSRVLTMLCAKNWIPHLCRWPHYFTAFQIPGILINILLVQKLRPKSVSTHMWMDSNLENEAFQPLGSFHYNV